VDASNEAGSRPDGRAPEDPRRAPPPRASGPLAPGASGAAPEPGTLAKTPRRALSEEVRFGAALDGRLIRRLAPFFAPHKALLIVAALSYPVVAGLHLAQPYLVKVAVDAHFVPRKLEGFGWVVAGLLLAMLLEFAAKLGQTIVTQVLGQRVTRDLRETLFRRLQEVDLAYIEKNPVGRLMTRVTNDVESLQETFSTGAISIVGDVVLIAGIVSMMLVLDWRLTLYAFAILPFLALFVRFMRVRAREAFREVRLLLSRLNAFLAESISGMRVIQVFGQEQALAAELAGVNAAYRDANFRAIRYDAVTYAVIEALATIATACLLVLGVSLFEQDLVEVGVFVAFVDYLRRFFAPITELSTKYTMLQSAMASAERCVDLLDQHPTVLEPEAAEPKPALQDALRFEGVRFGYGGDGGPRILKGLDLALRRGEKVAVVGPTGAGKSTLVKLLCRFYDPSEGRITLDGVDLRELAFDDLRGRLAVVLQDPYLFDGTVRENLAFGLATPDEAVLREAARRTHALDVIERLAEGWDAPVGERGGRLSAGQRQLLAFARALARDPEILILDEATSSVDPETEALVQDGLDALLEGRTALIIAHRLSTVRRVDRIVVLNAGEVEEEGTHEALLARGGMYKDLYELQFADEATGA
jgi:ATP-binding cassette subfamily B protein